MSFFKFKARVPTEIGRDYWVVCPDYSVKYLFVYHEKRALGFGLDAGLSVDLLKEGNFTKVVSWEVFIDLFWISLNCFDSHEIAFLDEIHLISWILFLADKLARFILHTFECFTQFGQFIRIHTFKNRHFFEELIVPLSPRYDGSLYNIGECLPVERP